MGGVKPAQDSDHASLRQGDAPLGRHRVADVDPDPAARCRASRLDLAGYRRSGHPVEVNGNDVVEDPHRAVAEEATIGVEVPGVVLVWLPGPGIRKPATRRG